MSEEEHKKRLAIVIADAIQQLLRESDELSDVLEQAQDEGYDVFLSIFSGIVVRRRNAARPHAEPVPAEKVEASPQELTFTDTDRTFLHAIGIQID
jgi:hypothetical protein